MTRQSFVYSFASLVLITILSSSALAQSRTQSSSEKSISAAFIFAYYPKEGMSVQFNQGYKRHLEWHREHEDPLLWYGWYVVFGKRLGLFIDGSFGSSFEAFDNRVAPSEDRADFAQTAARFANPAFRMVYTLRRNLSTATPLENWQPSRNVHVIYYDIRPGQEAKFEKVVLAVKEYLKSIEGSQSHTWYELSVGGNHPNYMLMIPLNGWSDYPEIASPLTKLVRQGYDANKAQGLLEAISVSVAHQESEVWNYRPDLTYFPESAK